MNARAAGKSHVGRKRKLNEDSYLIAPDLGLYLVADGMGGHKAGEVASRTVLETMTEYWKKVRANNPPAFPEAVNVYITSLRPEEGDLVMVCSDGLTNYMSENAIKAVLDDFSFSIERTVDILIEEANRGGGGDNITVVLLEVVKEGRWQKFKNKFM